MWWAPGFGCPAVVVIIVLEVGVQRAFASGHLIQVIRRDHGEAILHKELV